MANQRFESLIVRINLPDEHLVYKRHKKRSKKENVTLLTGTTKTIFFPYSFRLCHLVLLCCLNRGFTRLWLNFRQDLVHLMQWLFGRLLSNELMFPESILQIRIKPVYGYGRKRQKRWYWNIVLPIWPHC